VQVKWILTTLVVMAVGFWAIRSVDLDVAVALTATAVLLLIGRTSGLTWAQIGLARDTWRRGLLWAVGALIVAVVIYTLLLVTPLDVLLDDDRYDDGWRQAWVTALLVVPLGTVLWEEVGFRGVLWAQLRRRWSTRVATLVSSLLFGVWHALPALRFADSNQAAGTVADAQTATVGTVVVTIIATAIGGVVLCEARRRSDSLLAPIGLHWAVNGVGVIAVAIANSS
jgi:membrane protease YdiL (CAAX protease family)